MAGRTKKKKVKSKFKNTPLFAEMISIIIIGISILIAISVFSNGGGGFFGRFTNTTLKGLFGIGAYLLPLTAIAVCIYMLFTEDKYISPFKYSLGIIWFILIISFVDVIYQKKSTVYANLWEFLKGSFAEGAVYNGGLLGSVFGDGLLKVLGTVGTYIFFITAIIISSIAISGKSFFKFVKAAVQKYYDIMYMKDDYDDDIFEDEAEEDSEPPARKKEKPKKEIKNAPKVKAEKTRKAVKSVKESNIKRKSKPSEAKEKSHARKLNGKIITVDIKKNPERERKKISLILDEVGKNNSHILNNTENNEIPSFLKRSQSETPKINIPEIIPFNPPLEHNETSAGEHTEAHIKDENPSDIQENIIDAKSIGTEQNAQDAVKKLLNEAEPLIIQAETSTLVDELKIDNAYIKTEYEFPKLEFLNKNPVSQAQSSKTEILENSRILEETLKSFGVEAKVIEISKGPAVTRYELSPGVGVKVSKILGLSDDLALGLAASGIRIEAPIPGKAAIGIEIPNKEVMSVYLSEVICDKAFQDFRSKLAFGLGKDIAGNVIVADIAKMPHMLIAGATGSGKSVCINTLISSILYKATPDEVKLIMVDPKVVELSVYNGIPHLLIPVVTDPKKAAGALNWAVKEMMDRYAKFAETAVRNLKGYNEFQEENTGEKLPQIVIIIDELADLMMVASKEVEAAICRLAQLARAAGIHLIIATQRPSVDVITGLIKANIPSRIAFAVSSGTDSRTIIDTVGAEKLLGKGDMLFKAVDMNKALRIQGAFVTDREVETIVGFIKENNPIEYDEEIINKITSTEGISDSGGNSSDSTDELTDEAIGFIVKKGKASVSMLQRQFRIGYNRAARIIEELEDRGIIGPEDGSKPRAVLLDSYEWQQLKERRDY